MDFFTRFIEFLNLSKVDIVSRVNCGQSKEEIYSIIDEDDPTACFSSKFDFINAKNHLKNELINFDGKICIYGDYDVDGLTSTSIMYLTLKLLGFNDIGFYIPSRYETGYGLNRDVLKKIISKGYNFIIAVDNGITKKLECDYLINNNVRYLILDHHEEQKGMLPLFDMFGKMYHRNDISAGYLALLIANSLIHDKELINKLKEKGNKVSNDSTIEYFNKYFETLGCLAVFSDCMNLTNSHNIALAKIGLNNLNENVRNDKYTYFHRLGLLIDKFDFNKPITYKDINYSINSKLNAIARVIGGNLTNTGVYYLTDSKLDKVQNYLDFINQTNDKKKNIVKNVLNEEPYRFKNFDLFDFSSKVVPSGLSGLIANSYLSSSKNVNIVMVICNSKINDKDLIGSLRAKEGVQLDKVLDSPYIKPFLKDHGGHESACGFTLPLNFKEDFLNLMDEQLKLATKIITKYMDIELNDLTLETINSIKMLEPFGTGFEMPKFKLTVPYSLLVNNVNGQHILLNVNNFEGKLALFNQLKVLNNIHSDEVTLVGSLELNEFNGKKYCQFIGKIEE